MKSQQMNLTCPVCSKAICITSEEVRLHAGRVVCPQCLADFVAPGYEASNEPQGVDGPYSFCQHCGKRLPVGGDVRFCPYCGKPLYQPMKQAQRQAVATVQPAKQRDAGGASTGVAEDVASQAHGVREAAGNAASSTVAAKATSLPRMVEYPFTMGRHSKAQPATLALRLVCYAIIAAQVAVFLFIIWKGSQL